MQLFGILLAGLGIGAVFGLFGAGGSAFATPVLALLGLPGVVAVASPLPAMLPASFAGARRHLRSGTLNRRIATLSVAGGVPGTILGALASPIVGGRKLVTLSAFVLLVVGARVLAPDGKGHAERCAGRRDNTILIVSAAFAVGILTGLLANGGGFLLVPVFVVILGLSATEAAGTSMVAVGALTLPTLITHWALGHIDWRVAIVFAIGVVPGSLLGARGGARASSAHTRRAFGALLVVFALCFLGRRLVG